MGVLVLVFVLGVFGVVFSIFIYLALFVHTYGSKQADLV